MKIFLLTAKFGPPTSEIWHLSQIMQTDLDSMQDDILQHK